MLSVIKCIVCFAVTHTILALLLTKPWCVKFVYFSDTNEVKVGSQSLLNACQFIRTR